MLPKTQIREDLPEKDFRKAVAELARSVVALLSGKLTLENVNAQVLEFDATSADTSIRKWTRFQSEPVEVRIAKVTNLDDPDSPSPYALAWRFEAGHVVFSNFTSLASGRHRIRAIALGGG